MASEKLTIVALIFAEEEKRELVKSELLKLIEPTRAEEGCINYDLHQDHENPNLFLFYENWTTKEHWLAHTKSSHIEAYKKNTEGAIAESTVNEMVEI